MIFAGIVNYTYGSNYMYKAKFNSIEELLALEHGSTKSYAFSENTGGFNNRDRKIVDIILSPASIKSLEKLLT